MIFLSILFLIVAIALPSINQNISKILYVRITSIIFICAGAYALYIQSIGSGIGIYSSIFHSLNLLQESYLNLTSTQLFILKKILLFSSWFLIGVFTYMNLLSINLKNKINNLSVLECLVISFTFFLILNLLGLLFNFYFLSTHDFSIFNFMLENNTNNNSGSKTFDRVGDAAIMGTAITAAGKIAQQMPNGAAKAAFLAGGVVLGGSAILIKNVTGQLSTDIGKSTLISSIVDLYNNSIYTLTGNNAVDLLNLIQIFNKLSILFTLLLFYHFIVLSINIDFLESYLQKYFPLKLVNIYIKSLRLLKKSAFILIICIMVLLLISNIYSYYYLEFFINNLEDIINFYFKK